MVLLQGGGRYATRICPGFPEMDSGCSHIDSGRSGAVIEAAGDAIVATGEWYQARRDRFRAS